MDENTKVFASCNKGVKGRSRGLLCAECVIRRAILTTPRTHGMSETAFNHACLHRITTTTGVLCRKCHKSGAQINERSRSDFCVEHVAFCVDLLLLIWFRFAFLLLNIFSVLSEQIRYVLSARSGPNGTSQCGQDSSRACNGHSGFRHE